MAQKRNVYIIATGGTIAGRADSASATVGYKAGELTVEQLIASVPGLDTLANLTGEQAFLRRSRPVFSSASSNSTTSYKVPD